MFFLSFDWIKRFPQTVKYGETLNNEFTNDYQAVTVIVPCFNCEGTIEKSIESVMDQTRKPVKIILVEDKSTDGTKKILRKIKQRWAVVVDIELFEMEKNLGLSAVRNFALERASTPWVALLDSDDCWSPTKLEKQLEAVETFNVSFCGTCDNRKSRKYNQVEEPFSWITADDILKKSQFGASSFLFRKNDVRFWNKPIEDGEFAIKYLITNSSNSSRAIRINQPLTIYPREGVNLGGLTGKIFQMTMARHSLLYRYFFSTEKSPAICLVGMVINLVKLPLRFLRKWYLVLTQ